MSSAEIFRPLWASPPGDTIQDALHEQEMSIEEFAKAIEVPIFQAQALIEGQEAISIQLARRLAASLGGTVEFWMARDGQYRDDSAMVAAYHWAETLPTAQMASFGWISRPLNWHERVAVCLQFFDVPDLESWHEWHRSILGRTKFRVSGSAGPDRNAIAAWLRRCEVEAAGVPREEWSPMAFEGCLGDIRSLTRMKEPSSFVPALISLCAKAGVAAVVVRPPKGCPVSGAARFLSASKPLIALSARYLADDHFWFTFFHEAAHILLHDPESIYVDQLERGRPDPSVEEGEADEFAAAVLVPSDVGEGLKHRPRPRDVVRVARGLGIAPGILVGQLQHAGVLGYASSLNHLKRRYRWVGASLERA